MSFILFVEEEPIVKMMEDDGLKLPNRWFISFNQMLFIVDTDETKDKPKIDARNKLMITWPPNDGVKPNDLAQPLELGGLSPLLLVHKCVTT